jgi:hypothetical protein
MLVFVYIMCVNVHVNKEKLPYQWKESIIAPIHKKGDKTDWIIVLSTSYKMLSNILPSRLSLYVHEIIGDHQCGFRHNRSTTDQIFCICQILEKKWEYNDILHKLFVDFLGSLWFREEGSIVQYSHRVRGTHKTS